MNKYFKKFGIMFAMLLGIIGIGMIQHGSIANAATVGQQLTNVEDSSWQRIDDKDSNILYQGSKWNTWSDSKAYKGGGHTVDYSTDGSEFALFKFYGTKVRLISYQWTGNYTFSVYIDDQLVNNSVSITGKNYQEQTLVFDSQKMNLGFHTVKIMAHSNNGINLDAIDIDNIGYLVNPNESISLDQSSMDMTDGNTQQLTATTTPAGAQVTWSSSDSSIATVDSNGNVTAVSEGQATITAIIADGSGLSASCTVTVNPKDTTQPTEPTGDANLYIELVDGQIKQYTVSSDEINKFTEWYENRDNDHSLPATYKFTKGSYTDYVVHDQIDWFEVR
jgi:uncharacterized protein YjdB